MNDEQFKELEEKIKAKRATKEEIGEFIKKISSSLNSIKDILASKKKTKGK